jgi:hypothetical protein
MSTIIGDVLLSSAFLAYAGYFDQHVSGNMDGPVTTWLLCLDVCSEWFFKEKNLSNFLEWAVNSKKAILGAVMNSGVF